MKHNARARAQRIAAAIDARYRRLLEIRYGDPLAGQFRSFGEGSVVEHPLNFVTNPQSIAIGRDVHLFPGIVLEAIHPREEIITLEDGVTLGRGVRIVAVNGVRIGRDAGIGHGCNLADTIHDYKQTPPGVPYWRAPLKIGRPLVIGAGAWIGNGSLITGGVTIGEGAIVHALTSVNRDVPPYTMVGGNPARALRRRNADGDWEWLVDPASLDLLTRQESAGLSDTPAQ